MKEKLLKIWNDNQGVNKTLHRVLIIAGLLLIANVFLPVIFSYPLQFLVVSMLIFGAYGFFYIIVLLLS